MNKMIIPLAALAILLAGCGSNDIVGIDRSSPMSLQKRVHDGNPCDHRPPDVPAQGPFICGGG